MFEILQLSSDAIDVHCTINLKRQSGSSCKYVIYLFGIFIEDYARL